MAFVPKPIVRASLLRGKVQPLKLFFTLTCFVVTAVIFHRMPKRQALIFANPRTHLGDTNGASSEKRHIPLTKRSSASPEERQFPSSWIEKVNPRLITRAGDDAAWNKAVASGNKLLTALGGQRMETAWRTMDQLTGPKDAKTGMGGGWTLDSMAGSIYNPMGYVQAYTDLKISATDDLRWFISQYSSFANWEFESLDPTGAQYVSLFNIPGRTLIAMHNTSPASAIDQDEVVEIDGQQIPWQQRLPNVQKWSDVASILWTDKAGDQASKLKYIFRQAIVTESTKNIIELVVQRQNKQSAVPADQAKFRWPGFKFTPSDEEFKALLGTVHGSGVAYLLLEHPVELPDKQIQSVQIFLTEENGDYHMLWTLSD